MLLWGASWHKRRSGNHHPVSSHSMGNASVNGSALQTLLFLHGHYQLGGFPLTERAEEKSLGAVQTCQRGRAGNLGMHHSPSQAPGDRREAGLKDTWAKGLLLSPTPGLQQGRVAEGELPWGKLLGYSLRQAPGAPGIKHFATLEHLVGNN